MKIKKKRKRPIDQKRERDRRKKAERKKIECVREIMVNKEREG